jgi:hypothetical protein
MSGSVTSPHLLAGRFDDAHLLLTQPEKLAQDGVEGLADQLGAEIGRMF